MKLLYSVVGVSILTILSLSNVLYAESFVNEFAYESIQQKQKNNNEEGIQIQEARLAAEERLKKLDHEFRMTEEKNRLIGIGIVSIAEIISLYTVLFFIKRTPAAVNSIVNASGLVFIIFGTIFVVRFTEAEAQLTPAIGIIGAVAGYLFGAFKKDAAEGKENIEKEKNRTDSNA